jgi:hypothetical protein
MTLAGGQTKSATVARRADTMLKREDIHGS